MARLGRSQPARPFIGRTPIPASSAPSAGAMTETAAAADTTSRSVRYLRTMTESAAAADTTTVYPVRSMTETAAAVDTTSRRATYLRSTVEIAAAADTTGRVVTGAGAAAVLGNPSWPVCGFDVDFTSGPPSTPGAARVSINAAYRRLIVRRWSTSRGRQYELDHVQAGIATLELPDPLELLNPDNPASPFNSAGRMVTPYRATQIWAMWPNQPGSGNIINATVDATYDASFEASTGGWAPPVGVATTAALSTAQAWTGTHSLLVTQPAVGAAYGIRNTWRTGPGLTYTFSCYVRPTGGVTVQARVVDALGAATVSNSASVQNTWQRIYLSWTTADTMEPITIYGTRASTPSFAVDATQLEFGANLTDFSLTGPVLYPLFTGFIERYPTSYDMAGTRARRALQAVDGLAILSRTVISQSYDAEIAKDQPLVYLPMTTKKPPVTGQDLGSGLGQGLSGGATPYFNLSKSGSFAWGSDSHPDGAPALAITGQNATQPPTLFAAASYSEMIVQGSSVTVNPQAGFTWSGWVRWTSGTTQVGTFETLRSGDPFGLNRNVPLVGALNFVESLGIAYNPDGTRFQYFMYRPSYAQLYADGQWHYLYIAVLGGTFRVGTDGIGLGATVATNSVSNIAFNTFYCEASAQYAVAQAQNSQGRIALFPTVLSTARLQAHYQRGVGYITEASGARIARLLGTYWQGPTSIAAGTAQMAPDFSYDTTGSSGSQGQQRGMLDVLQEIQDTERGLIYMSAGGVLVAEDRLSRYRSQSPLWVLGENPPAASPVEYPYSDATFDHDPTYTFSQAALSRPGGGAYPQRVNAAAPYGQRVLSQTLQVNTDFDLDQAGIFYLARYSTPRTRVSKLVLTPAANPALFAVVLSLELSQRVTVTRRTSFTRSADYYVEKIDHQVDGDSGQWTTTVELSPVFNPTVWVLGDSSLGVVGNSTVPVY